MKAMQIMALLDTWYGMLLQSCTMAECSSLLGTGVLVHLPQAGLCLHVWCFIACMSAALQQRAQPPVHCDQGCGNPPTGAIATVEPTQSQSLCAK